MAEADNKDTMTGEEEARSLIREDAPSHVVDGYEKYAHAEPPAGKRKHLPWIQQCKIAGGVVGTAALVVLVLFMTYPRFSGKMAASGKDTLVACLERGTLGLNRLQSDLAELPLVLTVNGNAISQVAANTMYRWASVTPAGITLDEEAVRNWATTEIPPLLTSKGATRTYTRADGKEVSLTGGTYGWEVDVPPFVDAVLALVREGTGGVVEVPMLQTAASWAVHGWDWGERYVDVDLSEQHAIFYDGKDNVIWDSDIVSGQTSNDHGTPEGVYTINEHMGLNQELRGLDENGDGEPDYISHVTYWMPFVDNLVAFHDAPWRGSFGGTIYEYNGSHGCVNLPSSKARELYDLVQLGDVVVVHW